MALFRMPPRSWRVVVATVLALAGTATSFAQSGTYGFGRRPTPEELKAADSAIGPDGAELPPGNGTAVAGRLIYAARCASCHGPTGKEGPNNVLVGGRGSLNTEKPLKTVGSFWPYATTVWDYVNRTMPFDQPGSLSADEVYATTAYLLFLNGIIGEQDLMDARTLPAVVMPNRNGFVPDPRPDTGKGVGRTPKALAGGGTR